MDEAQHNRVTFDGKAVSQGNKVRPADFESCYITNLSSAYESATLVEIEVWQKTICVKCLAWHVRGDGMRHHHEHHPHGIYRRSECNAMSYRHYGWIHASKSQNKSGIVQQRRQVEVDDQVVASASKESTCLAGAPR